MKTRKNRGGEGSFSDAAMSARRGVSRSVSFVGDKAMKAAVFTKDVSGRGFSAGLSLTKTLMDVGSDLTVRGIISPMTTMISIALPKAKTQLLKIKPIILPMLEKFENDDLTTVVLKMFDLLIDSVNKAKLVSITTWKPVFTEFIAMVKHVDVDDFQEIIDAMKEELVQNDPMDDPFRQGNAFRGGTPELFIPIMMAMIQRIQEDDPHVFQVQDFNKIIRTIPIEASAKLAEVSDLPVVKSIKNIPGIATTVKQVIYTLLKMYTEDVKHMIPWPGLTTVDNQLKTKLTSLLEYFLDMVANVIYDILHEKIRVEERITLELQHLLYDIQELLDFYQQNPTTDAVLREILDLLTYVDTRTAVKRVTMMDRLSSMIPHSGGKSKRKRKRKRLTKNIK